MEHSYILQVSLFTNKRVYGGVFTEFNEKMKKLKKNVEIEKVKKCENEMKSEKFFESIIDVDAYYTHIDKVTRENQRLHAET